MSYPTIGTVYWRHAEILCRKLIVGEQLAVLYVAVIRHKIVDTRP